MSTKNKNRHGRVGAKRSGRFGPTRKSDAYVHRPTIEESVATIPIAHRDINEAFSHHTVGTFRTRRVQRKERSWVKRLRDKIESNRALAKQNNAKRAGVSGITEETKNLLRKSTVAQLKQICDDNGIEYKSKDTKAVLLAKLGVTA